MDASDFFTKVSTKLHRFALLGVAGLMACGAERVAPVPIDRPMRIVSLDYCADQYVLKLVDRDRILAVSPDAGKFFSYMKAAATGLNTVRASAEDVLLLKPDLVVRSYGGGPGAERFFERSGVPVLNVGWASDLDDIRRVIQDMSIGLDEPERGRDLIAEFDRRLADVSAKNLNETALYMTPLGVTTGPGSLIHEMLLAAGLDNFQQQPGWRSLPLERLAYEQPDRIAAAFFESDTRHKNAWSATRHPVARTQMLDQPTVHLPGAWTSCGSWFLMDAIEALADGPEPIKALP